MAFGGRLTGAKGRKKNPQKSELIPQDGSYLKDYPKSRMYVEYACPFI